MEEGNVNDGSTNEKSQVRTRNLEGGKTGLGKVEGRGDVNEEIERIGQETLPCYYYSPPREASSNTLLLSHQSFFFLYIFIQSFRAPLISPRSRKRCHDRFTLKTTQQTTPSSQ